MTGSYSSASPESRSTWVSPCAVVVPDGCAPAGLGKILFWLVLILPRLVFPLSLEVPARTALVRRLLSMTRVKRSALSFLRTLSVHKRIASLASESSSVLELVSARIFRSSSAFLRVSLPRRIASSYWRLRSFHCILVTTSSQRVLRPLLFRPIEGTLLYLIYAGTTPMSKYFFVVVSLILESCETDWLVA